MRDVRWCDGLLGFAPKEFQMNKLAIGLLSAVTFSGSAVAADMAVKARRMPVEVGYNWSGFYVGLNGGYRWGRANTTIFPGSALATPLGQNVNGGLFGDRLVTIGR
jgi:outer membrane immunogenic protein